jgi:hypothetical protein
MLSTVFVNSPVPESFTLRTDELILLSIVQKVLDRIDPFFSALAMIHDRQVRQDFLL